jgi:SAM-dependent methyltransferase
MNEKDIDIYRNRYNKRIEKYGISPESLGWGGGKERQFLRFKILLEIGVKQKETLLDVGCGFADLYEFLILSNFEIDYTGVDINEKLINMSKEKNPDLNVFTADILDNEFRQTYDWIICCGIFNAKLSYEDNYTYIKKMITKMFHISRKGVAIDFMSNYVDFQDPIAFHTSESEIIKFVKNELKAKIVVRMDYLPYEFCVYITK